MNRNETLEQTMRTSKHYFNPRTLVFFEQRMEDFVAIDTEDFSIIYVSLYWDNVFAGYSITYFRKTCNRLMSTILRHDERQGDLDTDILAVVLKDWARNEREEL